MSANAECIRALVSSVSVEQARWKPDPDSWSILEVINHLSDEERLDFRVRLDIILYNPGGAWPPIDPQGWVKERKYNERELASSLQSYLDERRSSLTWLVSLTNPDWEARVPTPWGSISAGDMFVAWAAHDLLAMRQLVELQYAWTAQISSPYSGEYAGEW